MAVAVSVGSGVDVTVDAGVMVAGTDVAVNNSVGEMLIGDDPTTGDGEVGAFPPLRLHARVVNTKNKGNSILFISRLYPKK